MTDAAAQSATVTASPGGRRSAASILRSFEVDTRLLGMAIALLVIWVGFDIWSGGLFMSPRNLWNLSVQTSAVAVMATGFSHKTCLPAAAACSVRGMCKWLGKGL